MINFNQYVNVNDTFIKEASTLLGMNETETSECCRFLRSEEPKLFEELVEATKDAYNAAAHRSPPVIGGRAGISPSVADDGANAMRGIAGRVSHAWRRAGGWRDRLTSPFSGQSRARIRGYDQAKRHNKIISKEQKRIQNLIDQYTGIYGPDFLDKPELADDKGVQLIRQFQAGEEMDPTDLAQKAGLQHLADKTQNKIKYSLSAQQKPSIQPGTSVSQNQNVDLWGQPKKKKKPKNNIALAAKDNPTPS